MKKELKKFALELNNKIKHKFLIILFLIIPFQALAITSGEILNKVQKQRELLQDLQAKFSSDKEIHVVR